MNNGNAKAPTNLVAVTDMDVHTKEISQETHFLHMKLFFFTYNSGVVNGHARIPVAYVHAQILVG
jgi:hypothetical protein